MTVWWDVHTVPVLDEAGHPGPVRHYGPHPDEAAGKRTAAHLVDVLGEPMVAEAVDSERWLDRLLGPEPGGTETSR